MAGITEQRLSSHEDFRNFDTVGITEQRLSSHEDFRNFDVRFKKLKYIDPSFENPLRFIAPGGVDSSTETFKRPKYPDVQTVVYTDANGASDLSKFGHGFHALTGYGEDVLEQPNVIGSISIEDSVPEGGFGPEDLPEHNQLTSGVMEIGGALQLFRHINKSLRNLVVRCDCAEMIACLEELWIFHCKFLETGNEDHESVKASYKNKRFKKYALEILEIWEEYYDYRKEDCSMVFEEVTREENSPADQLAYRGLEVPTGNIRTGVDDWTFSHFLVRIRGVGIMTFTEEPCCRCHSLSHRHRRCLLEECSPPLMTLDEYTRKLEARREARAKYAKYLAGVIEAAEIPEDIQQAGNNVDNDPSEETKEKKKDKIKMSLGDFLAMGGGEQRGRRSSGGQHGRSFGECADTIGGDSADTQKPQKARFSLRTGQHPQSAGVSLSTGQHGRVPPQLMHQAKPPATAGPTHPLPLSSSGFAGGCTHCFGRFPCFCSGTAYDLPQFSSGFAGGCTSGTAYDLPQFSSGTAYDLPTGQHGRVPPQPMPSSTSDFPLVECKVCGLFSPGGGACKCMWWSFYC